MGISFNMTCLYHHCCVNCLTLCTLGKNFSRWHIEIFFFLIFPWKQDLTLCANCLHWKQFACNVRTCCLGYIRKKYHQFVICLISHQSGKGPLLSNQGFCNFFNILASCRCRAMVDLTAWLHRLILGFTVGILAEELFFTDTARLCLEI